MANDENPFAKYKFGSSVTPQQAQPSAPVSNEDPFAGRSVRRAYPQYTTSEGQGAAPQVGPPMPPPPESTPEGFSRAAQAGALEGLASIPGQFGDVQRAIYSLPATLSEATLTGIEKGRQFMYGKDKPASPEYLKNVEAAKEQIAKMRAFGEELPYYNIGELVRRALPESTQRAFTEATGMERFAAPTTEEISKVVQPYAEKYLGVGPMDEPLTDEEKIAKSAASFGTSALAGPGKLLARVGTGLTAGAASEKAGQMAEGKWYEAPARMAGALVGGMAPGQVKKGGQLLFAPEELAKEKMADVLKNYNVESSRPVQIMARNIDLKEAAETIPDRMRVFGQRLTGVEQDLPTFNRMLEQQGAAERTRVYDIARANTAAQQIPTELFDDLINRPIFRKAEENAMREAANNPEWGIVPRTAETPGNLNYWDQVKRELDKMYGVEDPRTIQNIKGILTKKLDARIPDYAKARDIASETFGAQSAPSAGMQFMSNIDAFEKDAIKEAIKRYSPEQRKAFNVGVMQSIFDRVEKGQIEPLAKQFLTNRVFQDKLKTALGDESFSVLRGKVLSENMLHKAWQNQQQFGMREGKKIVSPFKVGAAASVAAGAAFEAQAIMSFLQTLNISPTTTAVMLAIGGGTTLANAAKNSAERRIVARMFDLIQKEDPRSFSELDALTRKRPDLYQAILGPMAVRAGEQAEGEPQQAPTQTQPTQAVRGQASGGRIGRATGGRTNGALTAEMLMRAAHNAKKKISKTTEEILNAPDEAVVKALSVAKQHI